VAQQRRQKRCIWYIRKPFREIKPFRITAAQWSDTLWPPLNAVRLTDRRLQSPVWLETHNLSTNFVKQRYVALFIWLWRDLNANVSALRCCLVLHIQSHNLHVWVVRFDLFYHTKKPEYVLINVLNYGILSLIQPWNIIADLQFSLIRQKISSATRQRMASVATNSINIIMTITW